ncbi:MAG: VOC family protein [Nannocystaceae bacterium]|nr:VOC family protein [Nannocystaceae bacterium]
MTPTPPDWPRLSASLYYDDPRAAIAWLGRAFGFEARLVVEGAGDEIVHSELCYGEAVIMVSDGGAAREPTQTWRRDAVSPRSLGGRHTAAMALYIDDVDAHCARARAAGATIVDEPQTKDYGDDYWSDRSYGALDCEGHMWWFMQRLRNPGPRP